ncbi:MAG TPA: MFS transporter [Bacteroidales bacterium]|nr:MFS transporter [Bacteroidales bacterium]
MKNNKISITNALPVLFGFFVMGFCDVVGISTSYMKEAFGLSEWAAGFIPSMVFFWFLLFSVPTAIVMNRIGRKTTVQVSNAVTIVGMFIPLFFANSLPAYIAAFILLGIGNTILQVSLNPLLTNVVKGEALTSSLTVGQVVKAVCSFLGPLIAAFAATQLNNWMYIFPIYASITVISSLWLLVTKIPVEGSSKEVASIKNTFGLLQDKTIFLLFLGIIFVVGTDVGMNTVTPKLLLERAGLDLADAGIGSSVYFLCRTAGALIGSILLARMVPIIYYKMHILLAVIAIIVLYFLQGEMAILSMVGLIGYAISSIFPIIYGKAITARPDKANEISGLMITGVFGGAIVPPLMGFATEKIGNQTGSLLVITCCIAYLTYLAFGLKTSKK